MHNFRLWFYLVCSIVSSHAFAGAIAYPNGVSVTPIAVRSGTLSSTGTVIQSIEFQASKAANQSSYFTRAVEFSKPTTAQSIKQFGKRNALGIGLTVTTLAIGWALDSITKDLYSTPSVTNYCGAGVACYNVYGSAYGGSFDACTNNASACMSSPSQAPPKVQAYINTLSWQAGRVPFSCVLVGMQVNCTGANGYILQPITVNTNTRTASTPVTSTGVLASDTAISDILTPKLAPSALPKLHTDPVSGAVVNTQEVVNKATEVANEYERALNPSAVTQTAPTVNTGTALGTAIDSNASPLPSSQTASAFPDFCTWASTICNFVDWVKTLPPFDDATFTFASMIDEQEVEVSNYSSGMGSGSCPAPQSIMLMGNSIPFKFNSLCDFASLLSFFLLAGAYLGSIFILLGIKR